MVDSRMIAAEIDIVDDPLERDLLDQHVRMSSMSRHTPIVWFITACTASRRPRDSPCRADEPHRAAGRALRPTASSGVSATAGGSTCPGEAHRRAHDVAGQESDRVDAEPGAAGHEVDDARGRGRLRDAGSSGFGRGTTSSGSARSLTRRRLIVHRMRSGSVGRACGTRSGASNDLVQPEQSRK